MKTSLLVMAICVFATSKTKAQTAAYLCSQTGAYGYCYGNNAVSNCAYSMCLKYGGTNPYSVWSTNSKGYGALVIGTASNGIRVIGVAGGYTTAADAAVRARNECIGRGGQNVYLADSWNDQE